MKSSIIDETPRTEPRSLAPLRVALLSVKAANAMPSWRGVIRSLEIALTKQGATVVRIELGDSFVGKLFAVKQWWIRRVLRRRYQRHREPRISRIYADATDRELASHRIDVALSLKAIPMAYSRSTVPIVIYNDAPFGGLLDFYEEFTGLSAASVANGETAEAFASRKAAYSIYSSKWGAKTAIERYGIAPSSVSVIEMGANLPIDHTDDDVHAFIGARLDAPVWEFFWLGVDWERKRGSLAVAIVAELRRRGLPVHLTIAGAKPRGVTIDGSFVTTIPFLAPQAIGEHLRSTHFLLLPTRADCTPIVYNEANAFGVPVVSSDVGGIRSSIQERVNGLLLPVDADVSAWADRLVPYLIDREAYLSLAVGSLGEYRSRLNWDTAAERIMKILRSVVRDAVR